MSKRNSIITNTQQPTTLRRSPRLLHKQNPPKPQNPNTHQDFPKKWRKSPRLNGNGVDGLSNLRRSPRFSNQGNENDNDKELPEKFGGSCEKRRTVLGLMSRAVCKERSCVGLEMVRGEGRKRKERDGGVRSEEIGVKRKRRRGEDGNGSVYGWTKEQEVALQRAYFATKPTPHFWKKVSSLVFLLFF